MKPSLHQASGRGPENATAELSWAAACGRGGGALRGVGPCARISSRTPRQCTACPRQAALCRCAPACHGCGRSPHFLLPPSRTTGLLPQPAEPGSRRPTLQLMLVNTASNASRRCARTCALAPPLPLPQERAPALADNVHLEIVHRAVGGHRVVGPHRGGVPVIVAGPCGATTGETEWQAGSAGCATGSEAGQLQGECCPGASCEGAVKAPVCAVPASTPPRHPPMYLMRVPLICR